MNDSEASPTPSGHDAPPPADTPRCSGPLHLQGYLDCHDEALARALRSAVAHELTAIFSVFCPCRTSSVERARPQRDASVGSGDARADAARSARISAALRAQAECCASSSCAQQLAGAPSPCRIFSVKLNDEAGIVHAVCRRCQRVIVLYDRALYWGTPRQGPKPEVFPYSCGCGGHAFEVALGLQYPAEPLDENDLDTLSVAVRCGSCGETAVIFDDEAT